jgi:hypothetical protein
MLFVNTTAPTRPAVNLAELQEVRTTYLPTVLVRLVPLAELKRRADEISRQRPCLAEEAAFVVADEATRRAKLAASPLTLS